MIVSSSSTSIGSQYASATAATAQKANHHHAHRGGEKAGDSVELSATAKEKYAQAADALSSDFDPAAQVAAADDKALPATAEGGGKPVGGPPHGGPPPGGPPRSGGAPGNGAAAGDDAKTIQTLLDSLTDKEDTNGDGVVDQQDDQTSTTKAAAELKGKLAEWLAGDTTTSVGSYQSLVQQLSGLDSSQEESAS